MAFFHHDNLITITNNDNVNAANNEKHFSHSDWTDWIMRLLHTIDYSKY